jgi:hypothetical protein
MLDAQAALGTLYINWGLLHEKQERPEQALASYNRAVGVLEPAWKREPGYTRLRIALRNASGARAELFGTLGRYADQIPDWGRLVELDPPETKTGGRCHLALAVTRSGDHRAGFAQAEALATAQTGRPDWKLLVGLGRVGAQAVAAAGRDEGLSSAERETLAGHYGDAAVRWLQQARRAAGTSWAEARNELTTDPLFDPLKGREDFRALLSNGPA